MVGLALSGGGIKGAYEVGVYFALKKCHIKIDGFVGTSIGALNAAALASGLDQKLLDFWQNMDGAKVLGFTEGLSKKINDNTYDLGLVKEVVSNIKNAFGNKGLSMNGLREVLEDFALDKYLYKSKKEFGLVTVKFKDFKPIYMFKKDIKPELLNDYLIASCYLPIFRLEKIIDDNYYLDGGFFDNIPANSLLNKGYDKVYVVDLHAPGLKRPYLDKKRVVVINPSRKIGNIINFKKVNIKNNIKMGYFDTLKLIKNLDGYHYIFKVRGKWYYEHWLKKVNNRTKKEMMKFFYTTNPKKLIIKAVEFVMKKEQFSYFEVYNIRKVVKKLKLIDKNYGVYKFIKEL